MQNQKKFCDHGSYIKNDNAQDYHDMIGKVFQEMKDIRDNGGIKSSLDFGCDRSHDVIEIPVIQFIIGDYKDHDLLCGRKGEHFINMKSLCRDCDVKPSDGDDT